MKVFVAMIWIFSAGHIGVWEDPEGLKSRDECRKTLEAKKAEFGRYGAVIRGAKCDFRGVRT